MSIRFNEKTETWENVPRETTVTDAWTVLALDNGVRILSFGDRRKAGADVHVLEGSGKSLASWHNEEWREAPEEVMGALLRLAAGPIGYRRGIDRGEIEIK